MAGRSASSHGVSQDTVAPQLRRHGRQVDGRSAVIGRPPGRAGARRRSRRPAGRTRAASPSSAKPALVATRQRRGVRQGVLQLHPVQAELVERRTSPRSGQRARARPRGRGPPAASSTTRWPSWSIRLISRSATAPDHRPVLLDRPGDRAAVGPALGPPGDPDRAPPPGRAAAGAGSTGRLAGRDSPASTTPASSSVHGRSRQPVAGQGDRVERLRWRRGRARRVGRQPGVPVHVVQDAVAVVERLPAPPPRRRSRCGSRPRRTPRCRRRAPARSGAARAARRRTGPTAATAARATPATPVRGVHAVRRSRRCRGARANRSRPTRPIRPPGVRVPDRPVEAVRVVDPACHPGPRVVDGAQVGASTRTRSRVASSASPGPPAASSSAHGVSSTPSPRSSGAPPGRPGPSPRAPRRAARRPSRPAARRGAAAGSGRCPPG